MVKTTGPRLEKVCGVWSRGCSLRVFFVSSLFVKPSGRKGDSPRLKRSLACLTTVRAG